jgi:UDP-N-acetylmuramyl tripeptide synthase
VSAATRSSPGFGAKVALARLTGSLSRHSGRGGGTTLPGRLLLRIAPDAVARLGSRLSAVTLVSATNGKTTTAGMIAAAMRADGRAPVHNRAGSNMSWGVATALLEQRGAEGLFEVDEAWLPPIAAQLEPRTIALGNLFRDQLDRYGELERLADEWAAMVAGLPPETGLVLNADDPLVADLGRDAHGSPRPGVTYFGIEDERQALPELQHAHDAKHCRRCGAAYVYERAFVGHLGHYRCPNGDSQRPHPEFAATRIELHGMRGSTVDVSTPAGDLRLELPLPGLYNVYNALEALCAASALGIEPQRTAEALASIEAVFGRVETVEVSDVGVSILLIKNPAGANEVLRTLRLEGEAGAARGDAPGEGIDLWIGLNDRIADGRDVSWVWDADFELLDGAVRRVVCAGTRAAEMAVRLKYAGIDPSRIEVCESIAESLDHAVAAAKTDGGQLFALPTYTALLELRTLLAERGLAPEFWR